MVRALLALLLVLLVAFAPGCRSVPDDELAVAYADNLGPRVVFDPMALPVPDTPFPNDLGLTPSEQTASGLAINVSSERPSKHQQHLRSMLNTLNGFGTTGAATVRFTHPLDLTTVTDDSVILVNIEPGHPREGERIALNLAKDLMPTKAEESAFHGMDPESGGHDLLFPDDNLADVDGDGEPDRVSHYEVATHTLILQPLRPLAPNARHAVLLTRAIHGFSPGLSGAEERQPIRSAFRYKAHVGQIPSIKRALKLTGLSAEDLAFGWTYTTGDMMAPMQALRDGIYGNGPLAMMNDYVATQFREVRDTSVLHDGNGTDFPLDARDTPYLVQGEFLAELLGVILQTQGGGDPSLTDFSSVDYAVFGSFDSPDMRVSERRDFDLNTHTGDGSMEASEVPFVLWVPKATETYKPPFPVLFYFHGTGTSRMESMAMANTLARQGIATIAFDEVGHGPLIPDLIWLRESNPSQAALIDLLPGILANLMVPDRSAEIAKLPFLEAVDALKEIGLYAELGVVGRNEDENGNGVLEPAEAFYFADPFRMCASFWQDIVDFTALVKLVRGLDPAKVPSEPLANPGSASYAELEPYFKAGDFNADGVLDIGGPGVPFGTAGTSLGGIHAVLTSAIEPEITTSTPIVAGGGLGMVMMRSGLRMVTETLLLDALGTVIVGCPDGDGVMQITQGNDADQCKKPDQGAFGAVTAPPGSAVSLMNLANGLVVEGVVNEQGGFSLSVETDKGDELRVMVSPTGGEPVEFEVVSKWEGSGYVRSTPDFRRAVGTLQHALDRCDPSAFAPYIFQEPLPGHPATNTLMLSAVGDDTVPVASAVHLAAAMGLFGDETETEAHWKALRDTGLLLNARYDVDDILSDNPVEQPGVGASPPVETGTGVSAIRFADVDGNHTYIAGAEKDGFDWGRYHRNVLAIYHRCGGRIIPDDTCLEQSDCPLLDDPESIPGCAP